MGAFLSGLAKKVGKHYEDKLKNRAAGGGKKDSNVKTPTPQKVEISGTSSPPSFKRGGMVKKTGMAKVHKGERVLTKKQQKHRSSKY